MGIVYAELTLANTGDVMQNNQGLLPQDKIRSINVTAMVDSGCELLCINETICRQLGLTKGWTEPFELGDGTRVDLPVAEAVTIFFDNRRATIHAAIAPGDAEVLLGAIPMQLMDVLVDPRNEKLIVNPKHPFKPQHKMK